MSYALDVRAAIKNGRPALAWVNYGDPFIIASENVAQSGNVAIVMSKKTGLVGFPMLVRFVVAKASHIIAWQTMAKNDPFATTSLCSDFVTGYNVIFQTKNPITYQNMILKDGFLQLNQTIFTSTSPSYKRGLDYWSGELRLIICS